jgi:TonB family protein
MNHRSIVLATALLTAGLFMQVFADEGDAPSRRVVKPRSDPSFPLKQPLYPAESRVLGHDGIVSLLVLVGVDGSVLDQRAIVSTGYPELDVSALEITKTWKLRSGTVNGVPTKMWANFNITFSVEGKPKPKETEQHREFARRMKEFDEQMEIAAANEANLNQQ